MPKTCLITGGSRGIGAATIELLHRHKWNVIAPTRVELDMTRAPSMVNNPAPLRRVGDLLDALVFCHGVWSSGWLENHEYPHWNEQWTMRVYSPIQWIHRYLGALKNAAGCVVMVSSTRGFIGGVDTGPYSAACAAQIALMQGYAREYPGVKFNVVCPSLTATDMEKQVRETGGCKPDAIAQSPIVVAQTIVDLIESDANGKVMRVADGIAREAKWTW